MTKPTRLAYTNYFARDIEALSGFYAALFGFAELATHRSPIYRCLDAGGTELGFNAHAAYDLLLLGERRPATAPPPVSAYFTFEVGARDVLDDIVGRVAALGGRIVKPPYTSYYNAYQAVLEDPEGNVFRVNHRGPRPSPEEMAKLV
jgi:predicted enzyme related to lactoylglutathione lyase